MLKLYLKKLLSVLVHFAMFLLIVFTVSFLFELLISEFFPLMEIRIITYSLSAILFLIAVFILKSKNTFKKTEFMKKLDRDEFCFPSDIKSILKSDDTVASLIAIATVLLPLALGVAISENTPLLPIIIGTLILLLVVCLCFLVINSLIWCFVHKYWISLETKNRQ